MAYTYVRRTYGVDVRVGQKVRHKVTQKSGVVARQSLSQGRCVMVLFDGESYSTSCCPTELDYSISEKRISN